MSDPLAEFLVAATVPRDAHASGSLHDADALLATHHVLPQQSVHAAGVLGDADAVFTHLQQDRANATSVAASLGWDALTCLCFSRYLRLRRERAAGFHESARLLLEAGASANTGWYEPDHQPAPAFESVIYGAAGIAHDPELTRLLLAHGADPNDDETPYHAPESYDNSALQVLLESGRLTPASKAMMLLRKADWHDGEGMRLLLHAGADPNHMMQFPSTALIHSVRRDNGLPLVQMLLDHGGDPGLETPDGVSASRLAARRGRADLLDEFTSRGILGPLAGIDAVAAECARGRTAAAERLMNGEADVAASVRQQGGALLGAFAGNDNVDGVRTLLDLGVPVNAPWLEGDAYFDEARGCNALHVASWRASHRVVALLLARGADANAPDPRGRTPLALAVRACTDSYWSARRTPDSVRALLAAGADVKSVHYPTGYDAVDELLHARGAR